MARQGNLSPLICLTEISTSIGIIARLRHFIPLHTLHHIYRSLIQPYLLYGIVVWGRAGKIYRTKILCLQKRALRLMFFGDYKSHAIPFFISSNLLPLDLLYFKSVATLMHDVFNNLSPPQITNSFNFQSNTQDHRQEGISSCNTLDWKNKISPFHKSVLKSGIAYLLKCITRLKWILNAKFIVCFFKNSRRQMITLNYLIWLKTEIFWKLSVLYLHNPSRFCQHYLNVLVHYISYYGFVRLTWLNLSTQSNITFLFFFFLTLNIVK